MVEGPYTEMMVMGVEIVYGTDSWPVLGWVLALMAMVPPLKELAMAETPCGSVE
jgi:hypothetical protein